jgi:hypothetical protein
VEDAINSNCSAEEIEKRQSDWTVQAKLATFPDAVAAELAAKGNLQICFEGGATFSETFNLLRVCVTFVLRP